MTCKLIYYLCGWLSERFDGTECVACVYTVCAFDECLGDISITNVHPLEGLTRGLAYEINKNKGSHI